MVRFLKNNAEDHICSVLCAINIEKEVEQDHTRHPVWMFIMIRADQMLEACIRSYTQLKFSF